MNLNSVILYVEENKEEKNYSSIMGFKMYCEDNYKQTHISFLPKNSSSYTKYENGANEINILGL